MFIAVSIHAPARGATWSHSRGIAFQQSFNPRARTGRDSFPMIGSEGGIGFNPRARTGRDTTWPPDYGRRKCFNPRARTGRDPKTLFPMPTFCTVSIHAPARGATTKEADNAGDVLVSIHAPARGATSIFGAIGSGSKRFNPRARTGRDV